MDSLNKVCILGNVGKDPEIRYTKENKAVANISVATTESWKDKQTGEKKEHTEWHRVCVLNENTAKYVQNYIKKGDKVYLEGKLCTKKYTDKNGIERYSTEITIHGFSHMLTSINSSKPATSHKESISDDDFDF